MITIYVTYPDHETAKSISNTLLKKRLIACANIFASHESLYWWNGKIQNEQEVAVIYKSTPQQFQEIENTVKSLHPYDVPCIVSWDIAQGHAAYMQWINDETVQRY